MHCRPSIEPRPVPALQHYQLAATNDSVNRFQYLSKPLGFRVIGAVVFLLTWKTETQKKLSGIETKQKNHLWEKEGHPDIIFFIRLRDSFFLSRFDISETNLFVFCRFRFRGKSEKMDNVGIDQNRENINLWRRQKKKNSRHRLKKKPKKNSSFKIKTPGSKKTFFWVKKNLWWFNDGNVFRSQDAWNKASLAGSRALVA